MTDRNKTLEHLIEAARLLGITQARQIYGQYTIADGQVEGGLHKKIDQYRAKLAQPEQKLIGWKDGEPQYVAQPEPKSISTNDHLCAMLRQVHDVLACTALPMKRKWQGLTDDEQSIIYNELYTQYTKDDVNIVDFILIARAIESALRSKNHAV